MNWFSRNPIFYAILSMLMGAVLAGVWLGAKEGRRYAELVSEYEVKDRILDNYLVRAPSPTKANIEKLDRNYAALYALYQDARSTLNLNTYDRGLFFGDVPATRTDAFFEIAKYVEEARVLATSNRVAFNPAARFGFEEFANVGPVESVIPEVHRQVKVMGIVLQSLFDSGIAEFVEIKRERVEEGGKANVKRGAKPSAGVVPLEKFVSAARREGVYKTMAFRVSFKGQTISLRNFLNRLANSSLPFVINNVEVSLQAEAPARVERSGIAQNPFFNPEVNSSMIEAARVPIISDNKSVFTVTLEFLESIAEFAPPEPKLEGEGTDA